MSITSRATLTVPCTGPRVRGSAAYLHPRTAEWSVSVADYGLGLRVYRSVAVSGLKNPDSTVWARGCAYYDLNEGGAPEWLTVPHEWLAHAEELCRAALEGAAMTDLLDMVGGEDK